MNISGNRSEPAALMNALTGKVSGRGEFGCSHDEEAQRFSEQRGSAPSQNRFAQWKSWTSSLLRNIPLLKSADDIVVNLRLKLLEVEQHE
jgi:hypothetical protein